MKREHDSNTQTHRAKVEPGHPDYPARVAKPVMDAVDSMPKEFRELVHLYGYVDVYRAWRAGWTAKRIADAAAGTGRFEFFGA